MKNKIVQKELSYKITGLLFRTHDQLGRYCREKLYGDLLEKLLKENSINFQREYPIIIDGRKTNFIDFYIENSLLLDIKCKPFITKEDYYQMKRYLGLCKLELGMIVNFRNKYLMPKRILNPSIRNENYSERSDKFVG